MALPVGSQAPDFTLRGRNNGEWQDYTLSENRGKRATVILFFPAAFTAPCKEELCSISDGLSDYEGLGADVIAISVDNALSQEAWASQMGITVRLLSDFKRDVIAKYDVVWPDFAGLGPCASRAAFVVDRHGMIAYSEQTSSLPELPDLNAVKAAVQALS